MACLDVDVGEDAEEKTKQQGEVPGSCLEVHVVDPPMS